MRVSPENDRKRLLPMYEAAQIACKFVAGETRQTYDANLMLQYALERSVQIICEGASKVIKEFREQHNSIPWKRIIGMRQLLVHVYFEIDSDILWQTVKGDLPTLIRELELVLFSSDAS